VEALKPCSLAHHLMYGLEGQRKCKQRQQQWQGRTKRR
jgi:hypothetical protein